jgi:3-mercaptopyruvate sulfurtransferase SseA
MANEISAVLEFGAPEPGDTATVMEDKLRFHTDSWDLSVDLKVAHADIVVIDARSRDAYIAGHIPGAVVSLIHAQRVDPKPPIIPLRIYRNLLPILASIG